MKDAVDTKISYSLAYEEFDACIAVGLDLEKWQEGGYSKELKAQAMAWHRLKKLIRAHTDQALLDKAKRDRKK